MAAIAQNDGEDSRVLQFSDAFPFAKGLAYLRDEAALEVCGLVNCF